MYINNTTLTSLATKKATQSGGIATNNSKYPSN